jgi:chemotaxis protein CheX
MTGCVAVSGEWTGTVFLSCDPELASAAAEAMFAAEPGTLSADEVSDALGELTNMIGGNIKSLIPGLSRLSMPAVTVGASYTRPMPRAVLVNTVSLACEGVLLTVSVWQT